MSIGRLHNVARLMVGDGDLADDAVQEALILAWRYIRGLRDPERFEPWIQRVLLRCVYRVTKAERRQVDPSRYFDITGASSPDGATDVADRDEIDRAFRKLKPEYRAVL